MKKKSTEAIINHLRQDRVLEPLISKSTYPESHPNDDVYLYLLESIISQQVSYKVAQIIYGRFLDLFDDRYPNPIDVIKCHEEQLRSVGLSRQKVAYVKNSADFYIHSGFDVPSLQQMSEYEVIRYLTQIKGVGKWTAEMVLMFPLDRHDIFPMDDLGIQNMIKNLYQLDLQGKELREALAQISDTWSPYRTIACKYLWNNWD